VKTIPDALADAAPGEFERIRRYFAPLAGPGGLGLLDDAALVECHAGHRLVMTADAIVAGVHFLPDDPPDLVAKKLLRVNLSDLAAMGARPLHYLLTTALPASLGAEWVEAFARGLGEDQRLYGVSLLGGDSVSTPGPAALSLTAIGEVANEAEIRRSAARAGDEVWVSGTIGDAFLGLGVLRGLYPQLAPGHREELAGRFRLPQPRVSLGPALAGIAHAMIDVSDGLLADLGHICETSHVGAVVELPALPLSPAARGVMAVEPATAPLLASGGDDYELLFTATPEMADAICGLGVRLGVGVTRIGRIESGGGVRLVDGARRDVAVETTGYRHF
jgi:thiamine-monophosphate kinase